MPTGDALIRTTVRLPGTHIPPPRHGVWTRWTRSCRSPPDALARLGGPTGGGGQAHYLLQGITFSRSGSSKPRANSLLSITEEAATSRGVDPLIDGEAEEGGDKERDRDLEALLRAEPRLQCTQRPGEGSRHTNPAHGAVGGATPNLRTALFSIPSPLPHSGLLMTMD